MFLSTWFKKQFASKSAKLEAKRVKKVRRFLLGVNPLESRDCPSAVVSTSQPDYAPGSIATFYANDFAVGEAVAFHVEHLDSIYTHQYPNWVVLDGSNAPAFTDGSGVLNLPDLDGVVNGNVETTWQVGQIPDSTLFLSATGLTSGLTASTTFTDGSVTTLANATILMNTNSVNGTGAFTALTGPIYTETNAGNVGTGTIVLNAPAGFEFDTGGTAPNVLVTRVGGMGATDRNINDLPNSGGTIAATVTASTVSITIDAASSNGVTNSLTWQNLRVRPINASGTLATGNLTKTGTSTVNGVTNSVTNFGTLTEVPIGFVQNIGTNFSTSSVSSISVTVPAGGVAVGDTIIGSLAMSQEGVISSVTDSAGNTYTVDVSVTRATGTTVETAVFSARVATALASGNTITVNFSANPTRVAVSVADFNGIASPRLDKTASANGNSSTPNSSATATTTQAIELLYGAIGTNSGTSTLTPGVGFTALAAQQITGSTGTILPEYRVVTATGTFSADGTLNASAGWAAAIATYNAQTSNTTTTVGLTTGINPSTYGDSLTYTATVTRTTGSGVPSGIVEFYDGATFLGAGTTLSGSGATATSTFTISTLNATSHTINAYYRPTGAFVYSGGSIGQTVNKATPTATLIVTNSPQTYNGSGLAATVAIDTNSVPGSVASILTGGAATQTNAGTYAVTASFIPTDTTNYNTLTGLAAGNFVIGKATPTASLAVNNSPQTYNATGQAATVGLSSSSVPGTVANILTGGAATQTNAGTYVVTANFVPNDTINYNTLTGLAAGDFVIDKATPTATLIVSNSPQTYNGSGLAATVAIDTSSVPGSVASILTGGAATQTNAGTYVVTANFVPTDTTNYNTLTALGAGNFIINKATPTATLVVSNSPQTYNGTGQAATVNISVSSVPGAVANILTGGAATQTNANAYAVTADFVPTDTTNYNTLTALSAGDFVIDKATPTATLAVDNSPQTYNGSGQAATVAISLSSVPGAVASILTGGTATQTNAGTYAVTANFVPTDSTNYNTLTGLSAGNFVIDKATPTATLAVSNSPQTYTGSGLAATVDISASSVPGTVANILTGGAATQTNAGTYTVTANFVPTDSANYNSLSGLAAGEFVIDKVTPTVTVVVTNSPQTYNGSGHAATVDLSESSVPGVLSNVLTGGAADQTNAGSYTVTVDFVPTDTDNYNSLIGYAVGSFVIDKATPTATLAVNNSPQTYNGSGLAATVDLSESSVPGTVANILTGGTATQTNAGTYAVTANFVPTDTTNYNTLIGLAAGNFVIDKANPTATLAVSNSPQTFTGSGQAATVDISVSSVPGTIANILTGGAATQTGAGSYAVTANFIPTDTANYNSLTGLPAGNFVIDKANPTVTAVITNSPQTYNGTGQTATIGATESSVPGVIANVLTGGAETQTNAGTYSVTVDFVPTDSANYNTLIGYSVGSFVIDKATPTATLAVSNSPQTYDGSGQAATVAISVSSVPGTVASILTGGTATKTNAGTYAVTANFVPTDTTNYNTLIGLSAGNFVIDKATPTAILAVSNSPQPYTGSGLAATVDISESSVPGTVSSILTGGAATQTNVGTYAVTANFIPTDTTNYNSLTGLSAGDFVIEKATPTVTVAITNSPQTYNGLGQAATVDLSFSSVPGTISNILTGGAATQTNAGSYTVTVDFVPTDTTNYNSLIGYVVGSFVIDKATPTATLAVNNSPQTYNASGQAATVGITASSVPGTVANILTGGASTQTNAGAYAVTANFVPNDTTNYNTLTGLAAGNFVIDKATPTATLVVSNSPQTYTGSGLAATVDVDESSVPGTVANILTGGAATQTNADTYAVTADFIPTDTANYNSIVGVSAGNFVIDKATPTVTVVVTNSPQTYNGTGQAATVDLSESSVPGALANVLTGGAATQTNAGTYSVTVDFVPTDTDNYNSLIGYVVGSFVIDKATPTATLAVNNSPQTYNATGQAATVGLSSSSVPGTVANILTGGAATQTNAGTYAVTANFVPNDTTNYNTLVGLAAGNFVIDKATPTATLVVTNSPQTYNGSGLAATVAIDTSSVPGSVVNILTGGTATQTNAGTYAVTANFVPNDTTNYNILTGLAAGNFLIDKATPTATLGVINSPQTYTGSGLSAIAAVSVSSVPGSVSNTLSGGAASQINAGTYAVTATFVPNDSANYNSLPGLAAGNFVIGKATPTATLVVSNSPQTYNGSGQSATVSISVSSVPGAVANIFTGGALTQTNASTYSVTADFVPTDTANYNSLIGIPAGTFTISKATPTATLAVSNSPQTYTGSGLAATVGVSVSSVPGTVANILTGGAATQTNAGSYAVTANFIPTDTINYNSLTGLSAGSFVIDKANPTVTLVVSNSPQTYNGTGQAASVDISVSSVPGTIANILTGGAATQTNAGTYAATANFIPTDTANYNTLTGVAAGNFVIDKATPTASLAVNNSPQTYNGSGQAATVAISVSSVPGTVANILTGGTATQTNAGTYAVTANFVPTDSTNYNTLTGLAAGNFIIDKATPTATLAVSNSPQTYTGSGLAATVAVSVSSVPGTAASILTGGAATQTNAGTYAVTANFVPTDTANYNSLTGLAAGNFVIDKANPTVTLVVSNSPQTYNGSGQAATVDISVSSVPGTVANILTGGTANKTNAGTYAVTANFVPADTANYNTLTAVSAGNFVIDKATPTATLAVNNSPQTYNGSGQAATVAISVSSVPGAVASILTGGSATQTNAGTYAVTANFVPTDTTNYNTLTGLAAGNFVIDKATPTATLAVSNSPQTYTGSGLAATVAVSVSSVPGTAASILTGGAATQTNAGTYAVTANFVPTDTANYNSLTGLAAGNFVIDKANPTVTLVVSNSPQTYNGSGQAATVDISVSSVPGTVANILTGGTANKTNAGTYAVTANFVPTDTANYNTLTAVSAGNFVIDKATPTATLAVNNSPQTYNGSGQAATVAISVSSVPGAVASILTGGSATQTNAGTYAVTANFVPTDTTNYNTLTGLAAGNFVINKATPTATLGVINSPQTYTGSGLAAIAAVSVSSVPGSVTNTLTGGAATQINAGTYAVTATFVPTDSTNYNSLTGLAAGNFVIAKATPTATLATSNSPQTYNGSGQSATVTISVSSVPGAVANIFTGGALTQTNASTYSVTADFVPTDTANYNSLIGIPAGTFTISKATPTATLAVSNSPQTYTGSGLAATVAISASSVPGTVANILTGGTATKTNAGTYAVTANFIPTDTINYNSLTGLAAGNFIIDKATPTATLAVSNSPQTYTGSGLAATVAISVSSVPGSVTNILTGGTATKTNAGTYAVTANFVPTDTANYNSLTSLAAGNFIINKATPTATLAVNNSPQTYTGSGLAATVGISASSVPGTVANILTGGAATQTNAGTYAATANFVPTDTSNYNSLTGLVAGNFVIGTKALTVTGITANNKNFDGTTAATLNVGAAQLVGVIGSDAVNLNTSNAVGTFVDAARGGPKTVFVTGLTLTGAAASNYSVTQPTTTATIFDDFALNGNTGDDTLVLSSNGPTGAVTYVLNNGTPVSLTGVKNFTFNGLAGNDTMRIVLPTSGLLLAGSAIFDGGTNTANGDTLVVDSQFQQVRTALGTIFGRNQVDGAKQTISYANVEALNLNNAENVNASFGPNTVDRTAAFAGLTANQRFVQALYLDVLGRAGSVAELNGWVSALTSASSPAAGRTAVVNAIEATPEARTRLVVSWYQTYLGRNIANDPAQAQGWVNLLAQGAAEEAVLGQILGTDEFFARAQTLVTTGTANERYIKALFNILLSRSPSPEDLASWLQRLANAGRTNVAIAFLVTAEYRIDQVEGYYDSLLRRPGDAAGLNAWANSGLDLATIRRLFEASDEFYVVG